jgi:glycosyltransferase involved in cell wall biosynthesis
MINKPGRILILIPGKDAKGGIATYYKTMAPLYNLQVDFIKRGSRKWPKKDFILVNLFHVFRDLFLYIRAINTGKYSVVQTNTSFSAYSILRDGIYLFLARIYNLKTIIFIHGWDYDFTEKFIGIYFRLFKKIYFKSSAIIDLAQKHINTLKGWGYKKPVYLETMAVDYNLIKGLNEEQIVKKFSSNRINMLFLARIERSKGIYEAIDAYNILKKKYNNIGLTIAGDGSEESDIRTYIDSCGLSEIKTIGYVDGNAKINAFNDSDIYLFPSYFEGMPTSLLEAMAFGLPVVTREVGGISDFFENGRNGYMTESKDPEVFASLIELLILNKSLALAMGLNNYRYANQHFLSDKVLSRMEGILSSVLNA